MVPEATAETWARYAMSRNEKMYIRDRSVECAPNFFIYMHSVLTGLQITCHNYTASVGRLGTQLERSTKPISSFDRFHPGTSDLWWHIGPDVPVVAPAVWRKRQLHRVRERRLVPRPRLRAGCHSLLQHGVLLRVPDRAPALHPTARHGQEEKPVAQ